jgi:GntR family transcriptional regulator, transcriptional repressor for pyruvate dehydrogenase complex
MDIMDVFTPVKPKRISDDIVKQLSSLISSGKLQPGEKLPPERELAKSLNVSRVSLREALNTLQGMGLIEIQQGNRTFVRPMTTRSISDPFVLFCKQSPKNILQVFEVRKCLEIETVALAAERANPKQVQEMEGVIKRMEEDLKKGRLGAKSDLDFHSAIVNATQNLAFKHLMTTLYDLLQEELRIAWGGIFNSLDSRKVLLQQHSNILLAIKGRDPDKGRKVSREHLEFVEQKWKAAFSKNQSNFLS